MSAKSNVQQGRRTPLSLSGAVTKIQTNKVSNNVTNGGSVNANGHPAPSSSKQDNKLQQPKGDQITVNSFESKEIQIKQQPQVEKKTSQNESKNPLKNSKWCK
ncbi:hypothetical protein EVAR_68648_1 [Eumeta japonica]|uniref:Uncharacterized protein n=1 Tax=Eumeta variegata TaxID=151549 RepID=A0A4C2AG55_EUMVA|nr:hypothetical protein EVAR_68648_1 [Eumeta japonica]